MGRRRKLVDQTITVDQEKASNASSEMDLGLGKSQLPTENSNAMKYKKNSRVGTLAVRRSNRIKSLASPTDSRGIEAVVEPVNLVEDEEEQEPEIQQHVEDEMEQEPEIQQGRVPEEVNGRSLEEKVDYLVRAAKELKSKAFRGQDEEHSPETRYKSLYFDSQKKAMIEALMEENYGLVRKLEFARGKIAAYEVMKNVVGIPKEVILVSTVGKAADITAAESPAEDHNPEKTNKKQARRG